MTGHHDDGPGAGSTGLYSAVETAIVCDWLERPRPDGLAALVLPWSEEGIAPDGGIALMPDLNGDRTSAALGNAVARLALSRVQHRLPQWAAVHADGTVTLGRVTKPARQAVVEPLPRFLFEINWADSGPGFSWPEAYHVAWLPGFAIYVITAAQDSPDAYGYTEAAIGHFRGNRPVLDGCHDVIVGWWLRQLDGWEQPRWACLFGSGEVTEEEAWAWADEVWGPEETERA